MAVKVGIVGCGNISGIYLKNGSRLNDIEIAAVTDIDLLRAQARADEYQIARVLSVQEMLADPEIEIILNLTIPRAHADVAHSRSHLRWPWSWNWASRA